jgi:biopolymer transport protein TolQ
VPRNQRCDGLDRTRRPPAPAYSDERKALYMTTVIALLLQAAQEVAETEILEESGEIVEQSVQSGLLDMVWMAGPFAKLVLLVLLGFSVLSWAIAFSKYSLLKDSMRKDSSFLKAFRRVGKMSEMNAAAEQYRPAPLVTVFEFGYEELARQVNKYGRLRNNDMLERVMMLAASEETSRLQQNMGWLATTASASPFIGLFGTVWGILDAFRGLGEAGGATLRAVAPGIAEALIATAFGLFAAIPALIFYNMFSQRIREIRTRMEDFGLEFYNLAERDYGEDDVAFEETQKSR